MPAVYTDWRLLLLFFIIIVLLISCTNYAILPEATPMLIPPITLTVHISHTIAPTSIGLATSILMPTHTPFASPAPSDIITLNSPNPICYENSDGSILCLGVVNNPNSVSFKDVQVLVELFKPNGAMLVAQSTAVLQHHIPPKASAPYHILFDHTHGVSSADFGGVRVTIVNFTPLSQPISPPAIILNDVTSDHTEDMYHIEGKLSNTHAITNNGVRMVITLYDAYEHVAGYRILEISDIPATADVPFILSFQPQIRSNSLRYTVYLEKLQ